MTLPSDDSEQPMLRPGYRRHSKEFKERVVAEYDLLPMQTGERGSFLRAHRLGRHQISAWRAQQAGKLAGKTGRVPASRRPKRTPDQVEIDRLAKQNVKLQAELARTKLALEITGKAHALLEMLSESAAAETEHERS
jgi:transposase